MTDSKQLASLIGPIMVVIGVTEAWHMDIFANQTAPVVYLNGAMLFAAGLAIVRGHNLWTWRWPVMVTLIGWICLLGVFGAWQHRKRRKPPKISRPMPRWRPLLQ